MERNAALTPPSPRVLLVEDDPVSRAFLAAAVEALPARVDAADTCAAALQLAQANVHALWLIDANLPDGHGRDLLRSLRAASPATPALAHTASRDRADLDGLIDAGFAEVLVKPLSASALQAAVRRALGLEPAWLQSPIGRCGKLPVWDDVAAAAALHGNPTHVAALRQLFLAELPAQREAVLMALQSADLDAARGQLHRLQASCGFVGASRLGAAVGALQHEPRSQRARDDFAHALDDLLARGAPASA